MTKDEARDKLLTWYELQKRQEFNGDLDAIETEIFRHIEEEILNKLMGE